MASLPAAGLSLKEAGPLRPEVGERRDERLDGAGARDGAAATDKGAEPPSATPGRPEHGRRDARETPAPAPESLPLQQECWRWLGGATPSSGRPRAMPNSGRGEAASLRRAGWRGGAAARAGRRPREAGRGRGSTAMVCWAGERVLRAGACYTRKVGGTDRPPRLFPGGS